MTTLTLSREASSIFHLVVWAITAERADTASWNPLALQKWGESGHLGNLTGLLGAAHPPHLRACKAGSWNRHVLVQTEKVRQTIVSKTTLSLFPFRAEGGDGRVCLCLRCVEMLPAMRNPFIMNKRNRGSHWNGFTRRHKLFLKLSWILKYIFWAQRDIIYPDRLSVILHSVSLSSWAAMAAHMLREHCPILSRSSWHHSLRI
jgi:hypothetical protein